MSVAFRSSRDLELMKRTASAMSEAARTTAAMRPITARRRKRAAAPMMRMANARWETKDRATKRMHRAAAGIRKVKTGPKGRMM